MFAKSAALYDIIYASNEPARTSEHVHALIQRSRKGEASLAPTLLDVACGTGNHIHWLREHYTVEGLDLDPNMLDIARGKEPDITFHLADMASFGLGRRFDVIVCLGSAIVAVKTRAMLRQTLRTFSRHLQPGGVVIVEPWLTPEQYREGGTHALFVDRPDFKVARMNVSRVKDAVAVLEFHYLVATPEGVKYFTERLDLGLFSHEDYLHAFRAAGLEVAHDPEGSNGRGLYTGVLHPSTQTTDV
jgi:ubiquinone/menaquinone biosynthesis C-methylase UbiE